MVYPENKKDILSYATQIWNTCDILRGAGIKESEFPNYMMPFFALVMVESRLVRELNIKSQELDSHEDIIDEIQDEGKGFNPLILNENKRLKEVCLNDKSFDTDLNYYLNSYDDETKQLLGISYTEGEKYLDLQGYLQALKAKKILFQFCQAWSEIDLIDYDNSEITTLEEHIKRKWADISAETSGEQYTPNDIINLISALILERVENQSDKYYSVYDMTCGGGNMVFGVEDDITNLNPDLSVATYGQELNTQLYALAKIESRFREESHIEQGNTLINDKFAHEEFDFIVANPPYGVDWKQVKDEVYDDRTGRYVAYPSTSDGQLLFVQHAIAKLNAKGQAIIVLNGSPLFSGDAGSGESNIRKWILDNDYLEGLIQLPTGEFFNTSITTYLWIINKNKPEHMKGKIKLINASEMFGKLKKNKGQKNKEITPEYRKEIVEWFLREGFENDNVKIFDNEHFYYNKQKVKLTNIDHKGISIIQNLPLKKNGQPESSIKIEGLRLITPEQEYSLEDIEGGDKEKAKDIQELFKSFEQKDIKVVDRAGIEWSFNEDKETIIRKDDNSEVELGNGIIDIKASYKKATKNNEEKVSITVEIKPNFENDNEIIPFSRNDEENSKNIEEFIAKWVEKPVELLENTVGVEVNFNKIFYKPEVLRPIEEIQSELLESHNKLSELMKEIFND